MSIVKWFKKKKSKNNVSRGTIEDFQIYAQYACAPPVSRRTLAKLPDSILERIFAFVCPHAQDETYESCEDSGVEDTCMLCDLRDLSHCAQVSKRWRAAAVNVL